MSGPANSPVSDSFPLEVPEPKKKRRRKTEAEKQQDEARKLTKDDKFPQFVEFLEARKETHRTFLPGVGRPSELSTAELGQQWAVAEAKIGELDFVLKTLRTLTGK